ncbi:hypothetical protein ACOJTA_09550 [Malaciobacter sp. WC5094]
MAKTLFIPIEVEAMVINSKAKALESYYRPKLDYKDLKDKDTLYSSSNSSIEEGVYIKWNLIEALKTGKENSATNNLEFPLVPNRWLVTRYCNISKSISKSWIVQSDYIGTEGTNSFIELTQENKYLQKRIGVKYDLKDWKEKNTHESFLTAMGGGGDIMFSVFQPFNENIFSIKDEWSELEEYKSISYFVAGWHNDKNDDFTLNEILKALKDNKIGEDGLKEFIQGELGLDFDTNDIKNIENSIYFGGIYNIEIKDSQNYKSNRPNKDKVSIALGNTDTDAISAAIKNSKNKQIFELFNEHILDKLDQPDSRYILEQELHKTWFEPSEGGDLYVSKNGTNEKIQGINLLQKEINKLEKDLKYLQKELFRLYYTLRKYPKKSRIPGKKKPIFEKEEIRNSTKTIIKDIKKIKIDIENKKDKLYEKLKDEDKLEKISLSNYYMPKDPTIAFIGLESKKYNDEAISCFIEEIDTNRVFPSLPDGIDFIYNEFLEPKITKEIEIFKEWKQPWVPLFIKWEANYYPIEFEKGWQFESHNYKQIKNSININPTPLTGKSIITPNNTFTLAKLFEELKYKYDDLSKTDIEAIDKLIDEVSNWDHLSQKLDGINLGLRLETSEVGLPLDKGRDSLEEEDKENVPFVEDMNDIAPILGSEYGNKDKRDSDVNPRFRDIRSGVVKFQSIKVVDSFGQSLVLVSDANINHKRYLISKDLMTKDKGFTEIVLPPRLLQTCRLNFDLVFEDKEDIVVDETTLENPILAWVLPNHLDKSLDFYDNKGKYLGKVAVFSRTNNKLEPLYKGKKIKDGHLKKFLESPVITELNSYKNFFETIDRTLWNIDPLCDREDASLSVLIGRPLALIRTRLEYELQSEPIVYRGWENVLYYQKPKFLDYNLPVLLGSNELRDDGLLGFFEGEDYDKFNCVHLPSVAKRDNHIKQIDSENPLNLTIGKIDENNKIIPNKKYMTMLVDPRGKVHATSHILPVKKFSIPNKFVDSIRDMAINFRIDSLLTNIISDDTKIDKITMPIVAQNSGEWDFRLDIDDDKRMFELLSTNNDLANNNTDTTIKSGYLNLTIKDENE